VLAEDVFSSINMPPFRQSAMDGYALCLHNSDTYQLIGEVKAGDEHNPVLRPGEAVRIFTGARVPDSADAVVMQEKVTIHAQQLTVGDAVYENDNIRPVGEQLKDGERALSKGTKLTPAAIGLLASLGITMVTVYPKPSVAIVVTGSELLPPGKPLTPGKIYESNSIMLKTALHHCGYRDVVIKRVKDDYAATLRSLRQTIEEVDVTIISGGISVGDYDFVSKAVSELGVEQLFYKVRQKPGKPLYFGSKGVKLVFGLPGNPAAALTCFYLYVLPALELRSGNIPFELERVSAECVNEFKGKGDRPQFLKAIFANGQVEILDGQASSMIHSFARSNALVFKPLSTTEINPGDRVETILIPL
jgi:molybdopterin molybdotransferase